MQKICKRQTKVSHVYMYIDLPKCFMAHLSNSTTNQIILEKARQF